MMNAGRNEGIKVVNIAIVEDDDSFASVITTYLEQYSKESGAAYY